MSVSAPSHRSRPAASLRAGAFALAVSVSAPVAASGPALGFALGWAEADEARGTDGGGVSLSVFRLWPLAGSFGAEAHARATRYSSAVDDGAILQSDFGLEAQWRPRLGAGVHGFLALGVGFAHNDVAYSEGDEAGWVAAAGLGIVFERAVPVRLVLRQERDDSGPGFEDLRVELGFEFRRRPASPEPAALPPSADLIAAGARERPRDGDGDGVLDANDRCPDTGPGREVDTHGCLRPAETIRLDGVQFAFGSARLTPDSYLTLDGVAESLRARPGLLVLVAGHTDNIGDPEANLRLSAARADAVRAYLQRRGVAAERLEAQGFGDTEPVADNDDEAGRALNRRVELRLRSR